MDKRIEPITISPPRPHFFFFKKHGDNSIDGLCIWFKLLCVVFFGPFWLYSRYIWLVCLWLEKQRFICFLHVRMSAVETDLVVCGRKMKNGE